MRSHEMEVKVDIQYKLLKNNCFYLRG